jgi:hypothetical protein
MRTTLQRGNDLTHEIVRAFEAHRKAVGWEIEIGFCVVMGL